jgi:hypothetical protein
LGRFPGITCEAAVAARIADALIATSVAWWSIVLPWGDAGGDHYVHGRCRRRPTVDRTTPTRRPW